VQCLQVQVSTNQLRRQDEENKNLREELEKAGNQERDHVTKLREESHRYADLESKVSLTISWDKYYRMHFIIVFYTQYYYYYF
jgi:hypothetical protein